MFNVNITRQTRNLEKLVEKLEALSRESVETGVFIEQGDHPTAEMSYVSLALMHEEGDGDFPPRTVRPILLNSMKNARFLQETKRNLNKYLLGDYSLSYALNHVGQTLSFMGRSFFGQINNPWMTGNAPSTVELKGKNSPLVDEGYLRDAWAYRTSLSDHIVDSNYV